MLSSISNVVNDGAQKLSQLNIFCLLVFGDKKLKSLAFWEWDCSGIVQIVLSVWPPNVAEIPSELYLHSVFSRKHANFFRHYLVQILFFTENDYQAILSTSYILARSSGFNVMHITSIANKGIIFWRFLFRSQLQLWNEEVSFQILLSRKMTRIVFPQAFLIFQNT